MKFTIKNRWDNSEIYNGEGETLCDVVKLAVKSRANLSRANLYGADLSRADLSGADLSRADLYGADLSGADLSRANLYGANLSRANLSRADLSRADLSGANLSRADLSGANLYGADLSGADLSGADLSRADLSRADLSGADLSRANLSGANLSGANLNDSKDFPAHLFRICPEGSIVGWKKLACGNLLCLEIPADSKRVNAVGSRKCRAEYAMVIGAYDKDRKLIKDPSKLVSKHDSNFVYEVGKEVKPDKFNDSITEECSSGIHFFITFEEARDY